MKKIRPKALPLCILSMLGLMISGSITADDTARQTASTVEPPRTVDRTFKPDIADPAYPPGSGPIILVDEAHNNFHTSVGLYYPFARLAERDGYRVKRGSEKISPDLLKNCRIYVIADAQPPEKKEDPPTFSGDEVEILNGWIKEGGSLFLITDHMPDPGAAAALAASFGIKVSNGYAIKGPPPGPAEPLIFDRRGGTLRDCVVTRGRSESEVVNSIATFAGSAFQANENFIPVLMFGRGIRTWTPEKYWEFPPGTPNEPVEGWLQGGILEFGKGRLAFFAEAAMFTAQVFNNGRVKVGLGHPQAKDNFQLLLNILHWLDNLI